MEITHGSTFSGIGAPEIAAEMLGWKNLFHCEINPFGRKVLDYYFPNATSYEDITKTDFSEWKGRITVLTGGFPCQPFSYAGKRRGSEDDRYLWPYMLRCIEQVRPTWFVGENVAGISTMAFPSEDVKVANSTDIFEPCDIYRREERYVLDEICQSLERAGYSVQPMLIPACAVGAPHRRDRVFIIAHKESEPSTNTNCSDNGSRESRESSSTTRQEIGIFTEDSRERGDISNTIQLQKGVEEQEKRIPLDSISIGRNEERDDSGEFEGTQKSECRELELCGTDGTPIKELHTNGSRRYSSHQEDEGENEGCSIQRNESDTSVNGLARMLQREVDQDAQWKRSIAPFSSDNIGSLQSTKRWRDFPSVSPVYRGNDGLPFPMDNLTIPFGEWKKESLKAYGNAIVPQVMYEIFRCINDIQQSKLSQL